jgi:hypothetical protein
MKPPSIRRTGLNRAFCACGALMCYAAAAILAPSGARSQLAPAVAVSAEPALVHAGPIAPVTPARDAFAPRVAAGADAAPATARLLPSPPPVAARSLQPVRVQDAAQVTAIVTGQAPSAIVEVDGVPQAVGIGDRIGGARITAIDAATIELDNGARLRLAPVAP